MLQRYKNTFCVQRKQKNYEFIQLFLLVHHSLTLVHDINMMHVCDLFVYHVMLVDIKILHNLPNLIHQFPVTHHLY